MTLHIVLKEQDAAGDNCSKVYSDVTHIDVTPEEIFISFAASGKPYKLPAHIKIAPILYWSIR